MTTPSEEWLDQILDAVVSDAKASGYFTKVNTHEVMRVPSSRLTAAIWVQAINPVALASGLAATSAQVVFMLRIFTSLNQYPQDIIDPQITKAVSNLMRRYHDDFDFGGIIRNVDLLGQFGTALAAVAGYVEADDGSLFRIMDLTIPCIVNDVWPQVS